MNQTWGAALGRVVLLGDVESKTFVERNVAKGARLENEGHAAFACVLEAELDERGADPASLPAGLDRDGVEMPKRLGRDLRCDPLPEAMVATSAVVCHVRPRILDLRERVLQRVCLLGRDEHEGTVPIRRLPDDPSVHEWLEEQLVRSNATFLEVVRPSAERPRHHRLGEECATDHLCDVRYPARIGRTDLHHGSSI